jgi:hypothetical protein
VEHDELDGFLPEGHPAMGHSDRLGYEDAGLENAILAIFIVH